MNKADIDEQVRAVCRMRRLSIHTERTYADWIKRFGRHVLTCPQLSREERVNSWLRKMAPHCSASTQNQALNAVVFLYRDVPRETGDVISPLDALMERKVVAFAPAGQGNEKWRMEIGKCKMA